MGTQFAHIELWTVRGSQRARMSREPGACDHIQQPEKPMLLYGVQPLVLADELEATARQLYDTSGRSTASRARVLFAAVYSYPVERGQADPADEKAWAKDMLAFNFWLFGK